MRSETRNERLLEELERLRRRLGDLERKLEALQAPSPPAARERIRTFVGGFDEALGGGVPAGSITLLQGPAGTMKTSLALSAVTRNAELGRRALYISLEETRESLEETMHALGLGQDDFIVDIATMRLEHDLDGEAGDWFQILLSYLKGKVAAGLDLLVIDPFNALFANATLHAPRIELLHFFRFLRESGVTTFLLYEGDRFAHREDSMADGVLRIVRQEVVPGRGALWIRCLKLRHAEHSRDAYALTFRQGRFHAEPVASEA